MFLIFLKTTLVTGKSIKIMSNTVISPESFLQISFYCMLKYPLQACNKQKKLKTNPRDHDLCLNGPSTILLHGNSRPANSHPLRV